MIKYFKNKKRRIAIILFVLLLLTFFLYLKIEQNPVDISSSLQLEKTFLKNEDEQTPSHYGEFETSGLKNDNGRDEALPHFYEENNSVDKPANTTVNASKELPVLLEIPKIGVSANVQSVGLNSKNEMGVPSNDWDVAWYNLGTKPGKIGSAVIAGHLDSQTGQPAVFWNLDKLGIGDEIFVTDGGNNKKSFQVISVVKYETGTAPMEKIFGSNDGVYLNLITCGGVWDKAKNNYSERFVVFAEYVL